MTMKTYLCAVTARYPEAYQMDLHAQRWGVEERYAGKIAGVRQGDMLVFMVGGECRYIYRVESNPFIKRTHLWPAKDGSLFPHRIEISPALYRGRANANQMVPFISFMQGTQRRQGTLQGPHGIFNSRLTKEDLDLIQRHRHPVMTPVAAATQQNGPRLDSQPAAGRQKLLFEFYSADLERAMIALLPGLGLVPVGGAADSMPTREEEASQMVCTDSPGRHVVVHLHRGKAAHETLLHLLHDMSWVRRNLDGVRDVRALLLTETLDPALNDLVSEIPNIQARCYRLAIELIG
jgi:hypothetical protein